MKRDRLNRVLALVCSLALLLCLLPAAAAEPLLISPAPGASDQLSDEQKALIAYAEAMLARGARVQYADTRLVSEESVKMYRWQKDTLSAEAYTSQYTGYTNCSNFGHDVYYFGLGYDIGHDATARRIPGGANALAYSSNDQSIAADERSLILFHKVTGLETEQEKSELLAQFRAALQPADLIVYRYSDKNSGHVMFYVGDGRIIHSTGSTYDFTARVEKREAKGGVAEMDVSALLEKGNYRYLFENKSQFAIIRPLALWGEGDTIPQESLDRLADLQGVVAEKLCSGTVGQSVGADEILSYTIRIENRNDAPVTLAVKDTVPERTSFETGCDAVNGRSLSWTAVVPAGQTVEITYTVRVNANARPGDKIVADQATVGGVKCPCPAVYVGRHLLEEEKAEVTRAAEGNATDFTGWTLAADVYEDALSIDLDAIVSVPEIFASLFTRGPLPGIFAVRAESPFVSSLAPTMYGGRSVMKSEIFDGVRTRGPLMGQLEIGDIAIATDSTAAKPDEGDCLLWMITGEDQVLSLSGGAPKFLRGSAAQEALDTLISYQRFAVLRPAALPDRKTVEADARLLADTDAKSLFPELTGEGVKAVIYQNDFESCPVGEDALWPTVLAGQELATNVTEKDAATVRYDIVQDGDNKVLQLFSAQKKTPWMKINKPITGPYTVQFDFKFEQGQSLNQFLYLTLFQDSKIHAFAHLSPDGLRFQFKPLTTDQTSDNVNYPSKLASSELTKPGTWHTVKLTRVDGGLYLKVWDKGRSEPEKWTLELEHEVLDASQPSFFRMQYYVAGTSNSVPAENVKNTMQVDNLLITRQGESADVTPDGFADVAADAWYKDAVDYVYKNGVMSGYSTGAFGPDDTLTRAMVVQVLYNKEGKPASDAPDPFSDVPEGQWYCNAVRWGAARNIVAGYGGGVFKPDDAVTLEQVAVILNNYAGKPPISCGCSGSGLGAHSDWAEEAVCWASAVGLFEGMPEFSLTEAATRAQTALLLMNFLKQ